MLLNEVTALDLQRVTSEILANQRKFTKDMVALAKTQNPLYEVWVSVQADHARNQHRENPLNAQDIHNLVFDVGMRCLRILALAAQNGSTKNDAMILQNTLMEDPDTKPTEPAIDAQEETLMLLELLQMKRPPPSA